MTRAGDATPSGTTDGQAEQPAPARERSEMPPEMKRSNVRFALSLPLFFMVMFPLCYITALHLPSPHHLPVAVVGAGASAFIAGVGPSLAGQFDLTPVSSPGQAADMILNQTVKAAYVPAPSGESAQLMVAGADGRVLTQLVPAVFRPIAAQSGNTLQVQDIAPLAPGDGNGIGLMFFMLIVMIVGFMTANILGNAAFFLALRTRVAISAGIAVLAPVVLWAFMGPWLEIIVGSPGQILAVIAIGAVASFIVGLMTAAAVVFIGKWALFPCMLVFVFLNIPSSNSAYPAEIVPSFFGAVSDVHLGAAMVGAIRSVLYLRGAGLGGHLGTMAVWLAFAVLLILVAVVYRHRMASSTTTEDEQQLSAEAGRAVRGLVHDQHGKPLPTAIVTLVAPTGTQSGSTSVDDGGGFHIDDLAEGCYTVVVSAPGHHPAAHTAVLNGHHPHRAGEGADDLDAIRLIPR